MLVDFLFVVVVSDDTLLSPNRSSRYYSSLVYKPSPQYLPPKRSYLHYILYISSFRKNKLICGSLLCSSCILHWIGVFLHSCSRFPCFISPVIRCSVGISSIFIACYLGESSLVLLSLSRFLCWRILLGIFFSCFSLLCFSETTDFIIDVLVCLLRYIKIERNAYRFVIFC